MSLFIAIMTSIMIFFLVVNSFHALLICCSIAELWAHWKFVDDDYFRTLLGTAGLAPVSVVVVSRDRCEEVLRSVRALLALDYPRYELILVDDGSTDDTLQTLIDTFEMARVSPAFMVSVPTKEVRGYYRSRLHPRLLVIDKHRGGTADAMNAGINAARYPFAMIVASSVVFEPDALLRLMRPFMLNRDVYAVSGWTRITDGSLDSHGRPMATVPRGIGAGARMVEYLRTFGYERLGWNRIASNLVFPDMAVLFRRDQLVSAGGFRTGVETPATDIMVRMHGQLSEAGINGLLLTIPDLVAWIASPDEMVLRSRGRRKRQRGLLRTLWEQKSLTLKAEHGALGVIAIPYYWIAWVMAPVVELAGYLGIIFGVVTNTLSGSFLWAYFGAVLGYGMLLSVWAVTLEAWTVSRYQRRGDLVRLFAYALLEPFGPRQIALWARVRALFPERSSR
jgi:cellulose synthase/poly-beta-1,6-N-acetylglucosamine synthase-like glycosyltransferase